MTASRTTDLFIEIYRTLPLEVKPSWDQIYQKLIKDANYLFHGQHIKEETYPDDHLIYYSTITYETISYAAALFRTLSTHRAFHAMALPHWKRHVTGCMPSLIPESVQKDFKVEYPSALTISSV